jgi:hypothetical protein
LNLPSNQSEAISLSVFRLKSPKNVLKEFDAQLSKLDKEFTKAACKQFADSLHNPEMNLQYAQSITGKS